MTRAAKLSRRKRGQAVGLPARDPRPFDPNVLIAAVDETLAREQRAKAARGWLSKLLKRAPVADTPYDVHVRLAEALEGRELTTDQVDRAFAAPPAAVEAPRKIA